jgi:deazaflavin-dependent oxidoreductase (nitroreductase family)
MTETDKERFFVDRAALEELNRGVIDEFRSNDGKVGGEFEGGTLLLLHTTGAKSGKRRISPLAYLDVDGKILILGSYAGAPKDPAWVHNLRANPAAHIEVGADAYDVTARELPPTERGPVFARIVEQIPTFGDYQAKTSRVIPLFELTRA